MPRLGKSGVCLIAVDETMDRTNFVLPNANDALGADLVDAGYLNSASFVHLSSFAGELPFQAQQAVLPRLSHPRISFDPGELYCRKGLDGLATILKRTYLLFLTERELKYLTGLNPREGAPKLFECGVTIVACKRGRHGALVFSEDGTHEVPAPEMEVVDPTGAGDVFAAGFLAGLLLDRSVAECGRFAADVASQSVAGYGREKYPDAGVLRRAFDLPAEGGGASSQRER
jgi:ribokinase